MCKLEVYIYFLYLGVSGFGSMLTFFEIHIDAYMCGLLIFFAVYYPVL